MSNRAFTSQLELSRRENIHLLRCQDLKGMDCYYVLQCSKEKLQMVLKSPSNINDLAHYAKILVRGFGHEPSERVWQMLEERYAISRKDFQ